jgi:hypothetical protein
MQRLELVSEGRSSKSKVSTHILLSDIGFLDENLRFFFKPYLFAQNNVSKLPYLWRWNIHTSCCVSSGSLENSVIRQNTKKYSDWKVLGNYVFPISSVAIFYLWRALTALHSSLVSFTSCFLQCVCFNIRYHFSVLWKDIRFSPRKQYNSCDKMKIKLNNFHGQNI